MKKRIIAALLALCMPLALCTGCGSQNAVDRFFDTLEEIHSLKDYHLELTISSDEARKNGVRISGDVAKSNEQANLTLTAYSEDQKESGILNLVVDGSDVYLKLDDWANYVSARYGAMEVNQDANAIEAELLSDIAKDVGNNYIKVTAPENVFDLLSGSSQKDAVDAFSSWYQGLRTELKDAVGEKDDTYTLSLKGKELQTQLLARLDNLIVNEQTYRNALQPLLKSVEDSIIISGWTDIDVLDNMWSGYRERNTELESLEEDGKWNDESFTMTTAEKASDGAYQVSMTWKGDTERYVQANITPDDQAAEIAVPKNAVNYSEQAENLATVYMDSKNLLHPQEQNIEETSEDDEGTKVDWDQWFQENPDDTKEGSSKLDLSAIKGYAHIRLTPMEVEAGKSKDLPVVTDYDYCEATFTDQGNANVIYLSSDSWEVDVYGLEAEGRSMKEILSESIKSYATTYKEDWGYEITQKASGVQKNSDGSAYVAGFSYYDEDKECEVTLVNLVTQMKGSSYVVNYEFALFGNAVQKDNVVALKEFCDYFGLDVPVKIAQK